MLNDIFSPHLTFERMEIILVHQQKLRTIAKNRTKFWPLDVMGKEQECKLKK